MNPDYTTTTTSPQLEGGPGDRLAYRTITVLAIGPGLLLAREGDLRHCPEAVRYWLLDSSGAKVAHEGTWQSAPFWLKQLLGGMRQTA